jgi:Xaa-Pro aminopeptidase
MQLFADNLKKVRAAMQNDGISHFISYTADPHFNEDLPEYWQVIKWLSGFTGSTATIVVTQNFAGLWTDSRYFIQAERELTGSGFELLKATSGERYGYLDFLDENTNPESVIGIDGRIFSASAYRRLKSRLSGKNLTLVTDYDPITALWMDRPGLPSSVAFDHPVIYCGTDRAARISEVRDQIGRKELEFLFLASPDDIMWLLNIRGKDLSYSPLILSFALIGGDQILLFVDENKIPALLAAEFDDLGIVILPYDEVSSIVSQVTSGSKVLVDPETTSVSLHTSLSEQTVIVEGKSTPSVLKAIRNKTEIKNTCDTMIKDGIALTKFFIWLEDTIGRQELSELALAEKILDFRAMQEGFLGPSFETIIAFNGNGALPHYTPSPERNALIGERGILLVDSGGQYFGGTTDITRTISVGTPTMEQKRDFTLVLKGHINLACAKFPEGTRGYQLDAMARMALWDAGLNYGHGTGHGVGFCLNVHEGPQSISPAANMTILLPGMVISNEPAIYRVDEYGIRTENLILCYEDEMTEFGQFLKFDTISLCFIDKSLIEKSLLSPVQIEWLDSYHSEVYYKLGPFLSDREKEWLKIKTAPL